MPYIIIAILSVFAVLAVIFTYYDFESQKKRYKAIDVYSGNWMGCVITSLILTLVWSWTIMSWKNDKAYAAEIEYRDIQTTETNESESFQYIIYGDAKINITEMKGLFYDPVTWKIKIVLNEHVHLGIDWNIRDGNKGDIDKDWEFIAEKRK